MIETDRIVDQVKAVSDSVGSAVRREFGSDIYKPPLTVEHSGAVAEYKEMQRYARNPDVVVIPTAENMKVLSEAPSTAFGVVAEGRVRPGVITARSTAGQLDITYLVPRQKELIGTEFDFTQIDPQNPLIDPSWAMLLMQAGAVQDRRVGADHAAGQPVATELGHVVLSTAAVKIPDLLNTSAHPVHAWTAGASGIAGAATARGLYDFKGRNGTVAVEEATMTIRAGSAGFLLKIPELDQAMEGFNNIDPGNLTAGVGLVALQSQLNVDAASLQVQLVSIMRRV